MKNTENSYGLVTIIIHWIVALAVFGLFGLGWWMVELDYYSPWYQQGPDIHKSVGIVLFVLMAFRVIWKYVQVTPKKLATHTKLEQEIGSIVHVLLYVMLFVLMISGYLISTADGRAIAVFELFNVPGLGELFANQEDVAGIVHEYLAYTLMAVVFLHMVAAFKHHFIDKDDTLNRMTGHAKNSH